MTISFDVFILSLAKEFQKCPLACICSRYVSQTPQPTIEALIIETITISAVSWLTNKIRLCSRPYEKCRSHFTEMLSLGNNLHKIGLWAWNCYDDEINLKSPCVVWPFMRWYPSCLKPACCPKQKEFPTIINLSWASLIFCLSSSSEDVIILQLHWLEMMMSLPQVTPWFLMILW